MTKHVTEGGSTSPSLFCRRLTEFDNLLTTCSLCAVIGEKSRVDLSAAACVIRREQTAKPVVSRAHGDDAHVTVTHPVAYVRGMLGTAPDRQPFFSQSCGMNAAVVEARETRARLSQTIPRPREPPDPGTLPQTITF